MKKIYDKFFSFVYTLFFFVLIFISTDAFAEEEKTCSLAGDSSSCFFCPLFKILFNAGSEMAKKSYSTFSSSLGQLVLTFTAVAIAIIVLKNISSMGAKAPGELLNELMQKLFLCAAIYYIITNDYYYIVNMIISPIFEAGTSFVTTPNTGCSQSSGIEGYSGSLTDKSGGIPSAIGTSITCSVEDIEKKIHRLFHYGDYAFCLGTGPEMIDLHIMKIFHPVYLIDGAILYVLGLAFMIAYPWALADAVLQLGIAMVILPFAIAGYAFSITKNYLGKCINWILHAVFIFLFMQIMLSFILNFLTQRLSASGGSDPSSVFLDANGLAFHGAAMAQMFFILAIAWNYFPLIKDLAGGLSKGIQGFEPANTMGKDVQAKAQKAGEKLGVEGAKLTGKVAKDSFNAGVRGTRWMGRQGKKFVVNKFGHDVPSSTGSSTPDRQFKIWGLPITYTRRYNANGTSFVEKQTRSVRGRHIKKARDTYAAVRKIYDRRDPTKLIGQETTLSKDFTKNLFDSRGNLDMKKLDDMLKNSDLAQNQEYKEAIMIAVGQEALKRQNLKLGERFASRTVSLSPDGRTLVVKQIDFAGKETYFEMQIDSSTGQVMTELTTQKSNENWRRTIFSTSVKTRLDSWEKPSDNRLKKFFKRSIVKIVLGKKPKSETFKTVKSNGYQTKEISGNVTSGSLFAGTAVLDPLTGKTSYAPHVQKGHSNVKYDIDDHKVVDSRGNLAKDIDEAKYNYGMDKIAGQSVIGGQHVPRLCRSIDAECSKTRSNQCRIVPTSTPAQIIVDPSDDTNVMGYVDPNGQAKFLLPPEHPENIKIVNDCVLDMTDPDDPRLIANIAQNIVDLEGNVRGYVDPNGRTVMVQPNVTKRGNSFYDDTGNFIGMIPC